jgi:hypothetical protein
VYRVWCFVRHVGITEHMALSVEVEASWVARPDIVAKLMPSKRWQLTNVDIRPAMYVKVDHVSIEGRLRLVFPLQHTLPIFNGLSISFLEKPQVPFRHNMHAVVSPMEGQVTRNELP